ncbi:MAG TPA: SRPBCC domain-containing protein [Sphingobacteriaceae bacterium]|nr:SRPBCC domain-containing protein [Sphingobacteriaceae bacterium]
MKDFKAYFIIPAEPELVYKALTTETTIELWTGESATMVAEPGTEFSMWSGSIVGINRTFVPDELIEQEWYFGADHAAPSIVKLKLHAHKSGTSLEVRHSNIPLQDYDNIVEGWQSTYMAALYDFYS